MKDSIKKLIKSHQEVADRLVIDYSKPQIRVSKLASILSVSYESFRNVIEQADEHLYRKRALKRILKRSKAFKLTSPFSFSERLLKETVSAKYLHGVPIPIAKKKQIANTVAKYVLFARYFMEVKRNKRIKSNVIEDLYTLCAVELDKILFPLYHTSDALINLQYNFLDGSGLIRSEDLPPELESLQTYIACCRANAKFDDELIFYNLFLFRFPFWEKATKEQLRFAASNFSKCTKELHSYIKYKPTKKRFKEIVRQSIPFRILDKVIAKNVSNAEEVLSNKDTLSTEIETICKDEYSKNQSKLNRTIVGSIIYIFVTKLLLALFIEVPYELQIHGRINIITMAINIIFPTLTMFVVANSFSIPSDSNTKKIKEMVLSIVSKEEGDDKTAFEIEQLLGKSSRRIITAIYSTIGFIFLAFIIWILYLIGYNFIGMVIFVVFFSTIFFVASRIRNTASELKVITTNPGIFAPFIDLFSLPVLLIGKTFVENASRFNLFVFLMDNFMEKPFKLAIFNIDKWNEYLREAKEELV